MVLTPNFEAGARVLTTLGMSILAVVIASQRSLLVWQAVQDLHPEPPAIEAVETPQVPRRSFIRRALRHKAVSFMAFISMVSLIVFVSGYVLPRYGSELFLNWFWGVLELFCLSLFFFSSINVVAPLPSTVAYKRNPAKPEEVRLVRTVSADKITSALQRTPFRLSVSVAMSLVILGTSFFDYPVLFSFVPAAWLLHMLPCLSQQQPYISVRRVTQVLLGYIFMLVLLCAAAVPIVATIIYFTSKKSETPDQEPKDEIEMHSPSMWMINVMLLFNDVYTVTFPAVLCAITYRFQYHIADPHRPRKLAAPGEAISVPTTSQIDTFSAPLFKASLWSLSGALVVIAVLSTLSPACEQIFGRSSGGIIVTVPVTVAGTAFAAWRMGMAKSWWKYEEVWVPKGDQIAAREAREAGNADAVVGVVKPIGEKLELSEKQPEEEADKDTDLLLRG